MCCMPISSRCRRHTLNHDPEKDRPDECADDILLFYVAEHDRELLGTKSAECRRGLFTVRYWQLA